MVSKEEFDQLLRTMIQHAEGISDLVFVAGMPMQLEVEGELLPYQPDGREFILTSPWIESAAGVIIENNQRLLRDLRERGSCDCGYSLKDMCRFRVSVYMQNSNYAIVLRYLQPMIPSFESLHLGPIFNEIVKEKSGLIFVTGGTGNGKTTTIAAILNEINRLRPIHILTLEDPIEFLYAPIKATFSQREYGRDFFTYQDGMRASMRQAPKIIFIGEIRDRETMEIVMNAGETGHLVFSTLHTTSASSTINRVLGLFSQDEEKQVRERLAGSLRYVLSLRLVPALAGGRLLVTELMGNSLRTREAMLLGESETRRFDEIIEAGSVGGWHTFEQSLIKAYEHDLISEETALLYCNNKMKMIQRIDTLNKPRQSSSRASLMADLKMEEKKAGQKAR